ncbi:histidine kinase [Adhaeribacter sp. BT258]|uniref:Histidine kinase n=1 Tax=Adhaeribacter terrigena TaxID=2793070 RepID=A0ABS1C1W9_9BACT|nr:histidine kinase [Adhaeribacter terrigena]MBK0403392.1 histidine kinase [Adhaeribacter terrigena]
MNAAQIDFQQLRIKHILYKSKVRSVLYGGTFDEAFFSHTGPVNFWFNDTGLPKYGHEPEMKKLADTHQDLNATALNLFKLYNTGNIDQAHDGLKTIESKSEYFLGVLAQLESKLT